MQLQRQSARKPGTPLFIALVAITLVGPLSIHMFMPALPHVRHAFAVDEATAQLTFSLAMMVMAFATLVYGSLSDRYGRLPVLLGGLALFSFGALIAVIAPNILVLIIGRLLQGAGAACGLVLARVIIRDVYGVDNLWKMIAYLTEQKMAKQYLPERLEVIDAMPRTPSGKIQKFRLREIAQDFTVQRC